MLRERLRFYGIMPRMFLGRFSLVWLLWLGGTFSFKEVYVYKLYMAHHMCLIGIWPVFIVLMFASFVYCH